MNYTTNYKLNKPERNEQFNLDDWNNNTTSIDSAMQTNKTNISNNATNITSILNGLSTVNTDDTSSIYYKLMKLIYPVGSLYWSSKSTNPASLFGGTWVQIKDRFVLACGDTYKTVGATGGASSVTLSVSNMPRHNHSFTPSGTITMNSHSHGLNNHTHSFTPKGTVSSTFTGSAVTTGGMSANSTGKFGGTDGNLTKNHNNFTIGCASSKYVKTFDGNGSYPYLYEVTINVSHTHSVTAKGTVSSSFSGSAGTTEGNSGNTTSTTSTGSFKGTDGTTGSNGSGTAFSIIPPYVVKYCWERTA